MASAVLPGETSNSNDTTTLDLLQRLQTAIINGQHQIAAVVASELAKMRANCDMTVRRSEIQLVGQTDDKPIRVQVQSNMTLGDLKAQIHQKYKVPIRDSCLVLLESTSPPEGADGAENMVAVRENLVDDIPVERGSYGEKWECVRCTYLNEAADLSCSVCEEDRELALGTDNISTVACTLKVDPSEGFSNYKELLDMENTNLIINLEAFECPICLTVYHPGEGVVLKTCLHSFCRDCLSRLIETSSDAEIRCPYVTDYSCGTLLQDREIRALVSAEVYDRYLTVCMNEAESKMPNTFHCKTPNCTGWCTFEDDVNVFICPVCLQNNCLTCQVIHTGFNCQQYQRKIQIESVNDPEANKTRLHLENMLDKGEAMTCPTCNIIILKKSGCDALTCTICKTEICWVTKGPRWGPKGRGDNSGGCGCSPYKKCHPRCGNCH